MTVSITLYSGSTRTRYNDNAKSKFQGGTAINDFIFHNPDKVYFGKNQMHHLPEELRRFGKKVLLVYGGGSIKRNGLYDLIVGLLKEHNLELFELSGVEPNPRHTTVNKGAAICREEKIDVILAAGGGSTIDCAKGIAAAALTEMEMCGRWFPAEYGYSKRFP